MSDRIAELENEVALLRRDAMRQNKLLHLIEREVVFLGRFLLPPLDSDYRLPNYRILSNDYFFAPASDFEYFNADDIDELHAVYVEHGYFGVMAWVSLQRGGAEPWRMNDHAKQLEFDSACAAVAKRIGRTP